MNGLRDYGTATWVGGDPECDHQKPLAAVGHIAHTTLGGGLKTNAAQIGGYRAECGKCGAERVDAQLGLEASPACYVAALVAVFRDVWRVLKPEGTVFLNLGDSYNSAAQYNHHSDGLGLGEAKRYSEGARGDWPGHRAKIAGLKTKDLIGVPWMVAFALRDAGWYLRSDIIWSKPNPMPESVTDRPTKAHEYLFLLSKSERYFYDAAAIAEGTRTGFTRDRHRPNGIGADEEKRGDYGFTSCGIADVRNKRSVWTIPTMPYAGAHFATMPEALVEPCILAGCPLSGLVLDPFVGSGTVVAVAERLGRRGVGVDLSYQDLARERTAQRGIRFDFQPADAPAEAR